MEDAPGDLNQPPINLEKHGWKHGLKVERGEEDNGEENNLHSYRCGVAEEWSTGQTVRHVTENKG